MQPPLSVSRAAIDLIKRFEGLRTNAAQLEDGRWTIGYGHTLSAREGATVSEADAEALLLYDLIAVAHAVNEHVYAPLNQNQFDALAAFAFNIGVDSFRRSAALRRLNEGSYLQAAAAMELWRKADFEGERIVIDALVRRRAAEKTLFLTPSAGWVPAPSAVLPPKLDYDVGGAIPVQTPQVVETALDQPRAVAERREERSFVLPLEDEPSASEAAVAAVTARLEALFREDADAELETAEFIDTAEPEALVEPEAPVETEAPSEPVTAVDEEPVFTLTPPDETDDLTGEPATAVPVIEPGEREPDFFDSTEHAPEGSAVTAPTADEAAPAADASIGGRGWMTIAYATLWIVGFGMLISAGVWGFLRRDDSEQLPFALGMVSFSLAFLLLGAAIFIGLRLLGGPDEVDGAS
jgi:lysozyme